MGEQPKAATIDNLAQSIAQMPLPPQAIAEGARHGVPG